MVKNKISFLLFIFILPFSFTLLNGCGRSPYVNRQSPSHRYAEMEAELLFDEAMYSYNNNDIKTAIEGFEKLIKNYPNSWKRAEAMYRLAESYNKLGMYDKAIIWAKRQIKEYSDRQFTGNSYFILGNVYEKTYNYKNSAESYLKAVDFTDDKHLKNECEKAFRNIIGKYLDTTELTDIGESYKYSEMTPLVFIVAAQKYVEQNDNDKAKELLEYTITNYPANPYTQEAEYLYDLKWGKTGASDYAALPDADFSEEKTSAPVDMTKIGLIAPFTGKYAVYGNSVKNGVSLALEEYNANAHTRITLIPYDSKGEPVEAVKATRRLIDNDGVLAVIGPIMSGPTISAASLADIRETVLISPTATEQGISSIGKYIFQLNTASDHTLFQAADMAIYAFEKMGFRKFATLYPNYRYAMNLENNFAQKIRQLGGEIVAEEEYLEGSTDFRTQMEIIKNAEPEAIYIPANAEDVLMIAPQLKFNDISAQILGSDAWNSEKIIRQGDYYVDGAVFTAIFYDRNSFSDINSFQMKYKYKNNAEPDITADLGYDSMNIILNAISKGATTRKALQEKIMELKNYDGVSGRISFLPDGKAQRKTFILKISDGKIIELNP